MNIFYLDEDVSLCAQYHYDVHVRKMCVEYAQILSTVHHVIDAEHIRLHGLKSNLYKPTHINHPSVKWCMKSKQNYEYLFTLWSELLKEFTFRFNKYHLSGVKLHNILKDCPINIQDIGFSKVTPVVKTIIGDDSIENYRHYYKVDKANLLKYTNRSIPEWI